MKAVGSWESRNISCQGSKYRAAADRVWIPDKVFLTPKLAPKALYREYGSVILWGFIFFTSLPKFVSIHAQLNAENRSEDFSLECKHSCAFHEPKILDEENPVRTSPGRGMIMCTANHIDDAGVFALGGSFLQILQQQIGQQPVACNSKFKHNDYNE